MSSIFHFVGRLLLLTERFWDIIYYQGIRRRNGLYRTCEGYKCKTCVLSVDAGPDGTYGNILVAAGIKAFRDDIEELTKRPFVNNTPYYLSLPKDMNFEDFIYRSAILGQPYPEQECHE